MRSQDIPYFCHCIRLSIFPLNLFLIWKHFFFAFTRSEALSLKVSLCPLNGTVQFPLNRNQVYEEKLLELRRTYLPINVRVTEAQKRPAAFGELNSTITQALDSLVRMRNLNNVLFKLDQSIRERKKFEQKQSRDKNKSSIPADQPAPERETTEELNMTVHPPTPTVPSTNVSGNEDTRADEEQQKNERLEDTGEKSKPVDVKEEKPEPPFVPLFDESEMESLEKLTTELTVRLSVLYLLSSLLPF